MKLVGTCVVEKSQISSKFGAPYEMHGASIISERSNYCNKNFCFDCSFSNKLSFSVKASSKFGSLRKALSTREKIQYLPTSGDAIFSETTESQTMYAHGCILFRLHLFIAVEKRETSCFLCLQATFIFNIQKAVKKQQTVPLK